MHEDSIDRQRWMLWKILRWSSSHPFALLRYCSLRAHSKGGKSKRETLDLAVQHADALF